MKRTEPPIIVEETFDAPIERVWSAITHVQEMQQWFFKSIHSFEATVGFQTKFIVENQGRVFPHLWEVSAVDPPSSIVYDWRYDGYQGDSTVSVALTTQGGSTMLRLVHTVVEDFPDDIPEFSRESGEGGWRYFIQQSLKSYLTNVGKGAF